MSPKLYAMAMQLSGALFCLLIIGTVKVDRANEVAVFVENVGAVVRHGMDPRLGSRVVGAQPLCTRMARDRVIWGTAPRRMRVCAAFDAPVLHRLESVGQLDELARGGVGIG